MPYLIWAQEISKFDFGIGFVIDENAHCYENGSQPSDIYSNNHLSLLTEDAKVEPFFMKPDYGLYHFICVNSSDRYYEVYINDSQKAFLPKNSNYHFQSWDAILLSSSVQRLDRSNVIRTKSDVNSEIITNKCEVDVLEVLDIIQKNGKYWLSIRFSNEFDYDPDENSNMTYGWIEWRTDNELLVNILLLS